MNVSYVYVVPMHSQMPTTPSVTDAEVEGATTPEGIGDAFNTAEFY